MRRMNSSDGIRSLELDFDKEILKINGQEVKERIVIVSLPGPEGYKYKKAFNMNNERISGSREVIDVCYYRTANDSKP